MRWWRSPAGPSKAQFTLDAEYLQFYLQDEESAATTPEGTDTSKIWTEQAVHDLLALAPGFIGVGTTKDGDVRVEVEVLDAEPLIQLDGWDQVVDCSIELRSGRLLVAGCLEPDAKRIKVAAGAYRVRIYYGGMNAMDPDEGDEHYLLALWPHPAAPPYFLKRLVWRAAPC